MCDINEFKLALYAAALTIGITVLLYSILQKRIYRLQNRFFLLMICIVLLNAGCLSLSSVASLMKDAMPGGIMVMHVSRYFYFLLHAPLTLFVYFYMLCVTGAWRKRSGKQLLLLAGPQILVQGMVLMNPFWHWIYYSDAEMAFHRNWGEYFIYGVSALYFVLSVTELFFSWKAITKRRRIAMVYFFLLTIVGVVIQLIWINIKSELFAEAVALLGAMLAIEGEEDRIDADTDLYNRRALQMDLNNFLQQKETVFAVFVKVINADLIGRISGTAKMDFLARPVADFFRSIHARNLIYYPNPVTYVLICKENDREKREAFIGCIRERFQKKWSNDGFSFLLDAIVFGASLPGELKTLEDALYVTDSIIPPGKDTGEKELAWLMRQAELERILRRSVYEGAFEVYYQPTYHMSGLALHGAEALVRMQDKTLGFVSPEEFIPVAERIDVIGKIDDLVLEEVCTFIDSGIPKAHGMDGINVNLSVKQCLQPGFVKHILEITDRHGTDHRMINFEITESVEAKDYKTLASVAKQIREQGFLLSMDDYGTGFSNMESMFEIDFNVVKVDKSILWAAEKEHTGLAILENSIRMIHDIGCEVLVEGVETEEQIELLRRLGADYLQGFYFSKPIPKPDFLKLIEK